MEAELNALVELTTYDRISDRVLSQISGVPRSKLRGSALEHYDYLHSQYMDFVHERPDSAL